jgi:peptidoglycan/LPS O-acetylase OafA/YrhL
VSHDRTARVEPGPGVELAPEFPALDTLRALGALAVLTTHVTFQSGDYLQHGVWGFLFSRLDVGVAIFFVLSGFLLSRPHLARAALGRPRPSTGRYYWKRLVRIYPVYVVTAVIALALIPDNAGRGVVAWVRTLLLADVYTETRLPQGLTQMWSLSVEVAFYAALPLLMLMAIGRAGRTPRAARVWAVLAALTTVSVSWHLQLGDRVAQVSPGLPMSWLPSYLTWFAVGIGLALLHVEDQAGGRPSAGLRLVRLLGAAPGASWAMAGALMLLTATPLAGPALLFVASPAESLFKHLVYAVVAALLVGTGVFAPREGLFAQVMRTPALRHLGHISFATFCIHLPILHLVMGVTGYQLFEGHGPQIWLATVGLSLVASELLYRLVEKPGLRLRNVAPPWRRRSRKPSGSSNPATRS